LGNPKSQVLVLGAGSSYEVDLPLGTKLKEEIAVALNLRADNHDTHSPSGATVRAAIEQLSGIKSNHSNNSFVKLIDAARQISSALPLAISIDNYIDSQRGNEQVAMCGKLAIAACIFSAEAASRLAANPPNEVAKAVANTWYMEFYQRLTENCVWDDLPARLKQVAVISFNYDRTIEHFLHSALSVHFAKSSEQVASLINENLDIFHPYGTIGKLPWQDSVNGIAFGANPTLENVIQASETLKTFTEGVDPNSPGIGQLRSVIKNANQLVFLGFAYHPLNLKLLMGEPGVMQRQGSILGTSHGISPDDVGIIVGEVQTLGRAIMPNFTCWDLFRQYQRRLSFR
jgi:hypothetical protein